MNHSRVRGGVTLVLIVFSFFIIQNILMPQTNAYKVSSFYETIDDSYEVLFFGSSMSMAIQPMELYEQYGIKSYNLSQHGQSFPISYWSIKDALSRIKPKVIVVDLGLIYQEVKYYRNEYAHLTIDNMPFSLTWLRMVFDVISEDERMEFLFPIIRYHTRWKSLKESDFQKVNDIWKGTDFRSGIKSFSSNDRIIIPEDDVSPINNMASDYLNKIIEEANNNDVELVFTIMPVCVKDEVWMDRQRQYNYAKKKIAEKKLDVIDFNHTADTMDINLETDFYDEMHLSYYGSLKATKYLGEVLNENFSFMNQRGDEQWEETLHEYNEEKLRFENSNMQ